MVKIVDNYSLVKLIGEGEYGKVYYAINLQTKIEVAVKAIPLTKFSEFSKLTELTKNQLQILKSLQDNINIIKFVEMMKTDRHVYLVYEYCQGGTLEELIRQKRMTQQSAEKKGNYKGLIRRHSTGLGSNVPISLIMPEKQALLLFKQLLNGFRSLFNNNILHRDVKPNNIFFKSGHLKLADFGFCKRLKNSDDLTQTSLGSPMYMAPQVLSGDVYGSKADVWSVGIVLYELLFGICPFSECSIKQMLKSFNGSLTASQISLNYAIVNVPVDTLTPTCQIMLMRMLQKDQFKRISWEDFFYEYEITEYGGIIRKEKDFEYDLMKLMKKNSSGNVSSCKNIVKQNSSNHKLQRKISIGEGLVRFNWDKITDMNSSIHSQQLDYPPNNSQKRECENYNTLIGSKQYENNERYHQHNHTFSQQHLDQIYTLKKKTKQFEQQHLKMVELSMIIESLISSQKQHHYSHEICYILTYNLEKILMNTLAQIEDFIIHNKKLLQENPNQNNTMNKIYVVFNNEKHTVIGKLQSIRISVLNAINDKQENSDEQSEQKVTKIPQVIKYSLANVKPMRRAVREYVKQFVKVVPNVLSLSGHNIFERNQTLFEQQKSLREQTLFLLHIIWGCLALPKPEKERNLAVLNIKSNTRRLQIAKILNKILVGIKSEQLIENEKRKSSQQQRISKPLV